MPAAGDIAGRLEHCKQQIIDEWEKRVRQQVKAAQEVGRKQLRNNLPDVLNLMIETLADPDPISALQSQEKKLAITHGRSRAQESDYSLEQVIDDYHVLSRVIFELLEEGGELNRRDRDLILDIITISIRNAATEFKRIQDETKANIQARLDRANKDLQAALGKKSSEAVLKDQLLRTIFERVEDYGIFSLDPAGNVASWSDGCQRIKQYTAAETIGKHYSMLYPPDARIRNEPQNHLEIAARQGRFRGEGLRMRKNGELYLADVFITPMCEGDQLVGYFKIVSDLTERNKNIQEIDLSRAQIRGLQVENQLRDQFIYMLSHDLRNPLSAVQTNAELIAMQDCSVDLHRELAQRSMKHVRRVDEMIVDLLDASRIKEDKPVPLTIEELDLRALIDDVLEELTTTVGDRFQLEAPAKLVGFWDGHGLKRVLANLATNAIKYGDPTGDVTINVETVQDRVIVRVHNFGSPISARDQESLFELFRRANHSQRSRDLQEVGWGLGLTLVRGITEAHGGVVKVRSLPKEGTTFVVDLPRDARAGP